MRRAPAAWQNRRVSFNALRTLQAGPAAKPPKSVHLSICKSENGLWWTAGSRTPDLRVANAMSIGLASLGASLRFCCGQTHGHP